MRLLQEQKQIVTALKSLYESITFHGIYVEYTHSLSVLASILKVDDAAELHYIMMHLSRLSYFKDASGHFLWGSERFMELMGCENFLDLRTAQEGVFAGFAATEVTRMEESARQFHAISSNLISSDLKGHGYFTCYAKVYPVYDDKYNSIGSLTILAQPAHTSQSSVFSSVSEEVSEAALLI